jgi:putative membrane protein
MIDSAIAAYAHFLSIFCTVALLIAELALFRPRMEPAAVRLLPRLDLLYLVAVIAIIVTGLLRLFFFEKGAAYYHGSAIFWIKMGLFVIVGLLSLPPTFGFIAIRKSAAGRPVELAPDRFRRLRRFIVAELAVFALIPLAATLMARGVVL